MKNKNKKFNSLKSILILLQYLQVKYDCQKVISIIRFNSHTIVISISNSGNNEKCFSFGYYNKGEWNSLYKELLDFLNKNKKS